MNNRAFKKLIYGVSALSLAAVMSLTAFAAEEAVAYDEQAAQILAEEPAKPEKSGFITEDGGLYYYLPETGERFVPSFQGVYEFDGKAYLFYKDGKVVKY